MVSSFPFLFLLKTAMNCSHSWFLVTSNWPSPTPSLKTTMSEGHFRLTSQYLIRDSIKAIRRASMISWPITNSSDNFTNLEEFWIYDFLLLSFFQLSNWEKTRSEVIWSKACNGLKIQSNITPGNLKESRSYQTPKGPQILRVLRTFLSIRSPDSGPFVSH